MDIVVGIGTVFVVALIAGTTCVILGAAIAMVSGSDVGLGGKALLGLLGAVIAAVIFTAVGGGDLPWTVELGVAMAAGGALVFGLRRLRHRRRRRARVE